MACNGVFTNLFRRKYANVHDVGADVFASLRAPPFLPGPPNAPYLQISHFKIGCAGLPWGSPTPPLDPDYLDLVASGGGLVNLGVDFTGGGVPEPVTPPCTGVDFYFCKQIAPAFISVVGSDLTVQCRLEGPEANDDGLLNPPHFYELGIFDQDDDMIVYVTFAEEVKTSTVAIQHNVTVTF
jgi:hypothetical protein